MKKKLTIVSMVLLCSFLTHAQNVTGTLKSTSAHIQFANVVLFKLSDSTIVDAISSAKDGTFGLKTNQKDSVFIEVYQLGYKPFTSTSFVGLKQFGVINLQNDTELDTLTISSKKPFKEISAHGTTFNVSGNPILQTGNAKRMLTKLPGVQIRQGGNISVNGKNEATVYVNGKRSYLESKDLVQYLQTIPADQIVKVELFDTPPARFDAEGNGSIINIIIRKPPLGTNGRNYTEVGYGNYYKAGSALFVNNRTNKFNIYGGLRLRTGETGSDQSDSTVLDARNAHYMFNDGSFHTGDIIYDGKIGLDYYQNEKNTFGIYYDYTLKNEDQTHLTDVIINADPESEILADFTSFMGKGTTDHQNIRQNLNLDFNRVINDSVNISSDFVFIRLDLKDDINTENDLFRNNTFTGNTLITSNSSTNINILALKTDYNVALKSKWKVDAGAKFSYIFNDNNFISYVGTNSANLVFDSNVSNDFKYFETIGAGYISIQKKWSNKWMSDIGGRAEHTNVTGKSPTENLTFTKSYFNFFPNVSLVYKPSKDHQFSLLYTERIDRPKTTELNPFLKAVNELEFKSGNPDLNPARDNIINFKYTFLEAVNLTFEAGEKQNYYAEIVNQDLNTGQKIWQPANIGTAEFFNINLGSPIPINKYWGAYIHLSYLYAELNAPPNHFEISSFSTYIGNEFNLSKDWTIGLSGWYSHSSYWHIWKTDPSYSTSLTLNKELGKWSLGLEAFDFLNIEYYTSRAQYNELDAYSTYKGESRTLWLNCTYKFGDKKIKSSRERTIGEDEEERLE